MRPSPGPRARIAAGPRLAPGDRGALLRRVRRGRRRRPSSTWRRSRCERRAHDPHARWEAGNVRDVLELLLGRAGAAVRPADPGGRRARRHVPASRSAWSASSCRGTSRCRSPSWGFAPALAAGNAVVLKPAELTPLTRLRLGRAGARGRAPARRLPGAAGQGLGRRAALRRPSRRPQGRVHGLDRGRASRSWPAAPPR